MRRKRLFAGGMVAAMLSVAGTVGAASAPAASAHRCDIGGSPSALGYVPAGEGGVTVINTRTLTKVDTIPGLDGTVNGYVTPDGRQVLIDDWANGTEDVINACTQSVVKRIPLGPEPFGALGKGGRYLYDISIFGTTAYVVDTSVDAVVRTFPVASSVSATISPDGNRLYVLSTTPAAASSGGAATDGTYVYNAHTGAPLGYIPTGELPNYVTISPDGKTLVAANLGGTVTVVDTRTMTVTKTFDFGSTVGPMYATVTPNGRQVWVPLAIGGVEVISLLTDSVVATLPTVGMADAIDFSRDGRKAFVGEGGPNTINTNGVEALIRAASHTWNPGPGDVHVYNTATLTTIPTDIPAGQFPGNVAIAAR